MLISFSGLDGCGKTTLIKSLVQVLEASGHRVTVLTMYYDISFYAAVRKIRDLVFGPVKAKQDFFKEDESRQINPHDPKIDVSDKNNFCSKVLYRIARSRISRKTSLLVDLCCLLYYRFVVEWIKGDVLITDRYLYDSIVDAADIDGRRSRFIDFFMKIAPSPRVPLLIDVPAETAFIRKREYPLDYMLRRRNLYHKIFALVEDSIFINNDNLECSKKDIEDVVFKRIKGI